jgi:hypothetical protein
MKSRQVVYRSYRTQRICAGLASLTLLGCSAVGLAIDVPQSDPPSGGASDGPVRRTAEISSSPEAQTCLEVYPVTPGTILEERVATTVEGQALPLLLRRIFHSDSTGEHFMEAAVGWFAADGPVMVNLTVAQGDLGQPVLRTVGRDLQANRCGQSLIFELPGPGQYYLQMPRLARPKGTFTVVFWVDDLRRLEQTRAEFKTKPPLTVTARGVCDDPVLDQTMAIQALLDTGGVLYFPPGVYRTGTLRVRSDTTVVLAPGAVLRACDGEEAVGAEFIAIENARNVKFRGPGIIDAASTGGRRRHNVHNTNITSSRDVIFEDVLFEESNSWAVHIRRSDRIILRNVRVFSGKDGFDPDSSRDVLIDGAFVISGDDAIAVKNRFPQDSDGKTTERVVFRNGIVSTTKSALKIGTETRGPIRDVTFENCDVFDGERGIVLYAQDGGPIERAVWRDIRLFMIDWAQEKDSGTVFHLIISRREGATPVRECLIENVTANWLYRSEFVGLLDAPLDGVTLRNIRIKADPPKSGKPPLFVCGDNVSLPIEGLTLDWQGNEARWAGIVSGRGLTFTDAPALPNPSQPRTEDEGDTTK